MMMIVMNDDYADDYDGDYDDDDGDDYDDADVYDYAPSTCPIPSPLPPSPLGLGGANAGARSSPPGPQGWVPGDVLAVSSICS